MTSIASTFVVDTPTQYLMASLIAKTYFPGQSQAIVYHEGRDFGSVFTSIDRQIGGPHFSNLIDFSGDFREVSRTTRLFICNRFNPIQIKAAMTFERDLLCAFEDALALYVPRDPFNHRLRDGNVVLQAVNYLIQLGNRAGVIRRYPYLVPMREFSEFYSVFPWVPNVPTSASCYSILPAFQDMVIKNLALGSGDCLFLSQPLGLDRTITGSQHLDFMTGVIATLSQKYSRVIYKAHPRDDADLTLSILKMPGVENINPRYRDIPAELYLAHFPGTAVYGLMSSTLAYAAGALGIPAFSFGPELERRYGGGRRFGRHWSVVKPLFDRAGVNGFDLAAQSVSQH